MTVYIKVPEVESTCTGCIANGIASMELCDKLHGTLAEKGCKGTIFIEDTEPVRLAYITLKLELS